MLRSIELQYCDIKITWADHLIPGLIFFPGNYNM